MLTSFPSYQLLQRVFLIHGFDILMPNSFFLLLWGDLSKWWKNLWKLKIPSKIWHFIWRRFHGCLPSMGVLHKQHMIESNLCPLCRRGPESIEHVLFNCKRATKTWVGMNENFRCLTLNDMCIKEK